MREQRIRRLVTMAALLVLLHLPAGAEELWTDGARRAAQPYLDAYLDLDTLGLEDFPTGVESILSTGAGQLPGILRKVIRSGGLLLAVSFLCGLAGTVQEELGGGSVDAVRLAGCVAVTAIAATDVYALMGLGRETLGQMADFSQLLLPVMTAVCAAGGAGATATARQGVTLLFFSLLLKLVDRLLLPLIYAYIAASAACGALGDKGLRRMAQLLRQGAAALMSALFTGFVLYLTVSGALAGNSDAMVQKAAKSALNDLVPVVGKILSDAAETVAAGAGVARGTVGVIGLLAVLALCVGPFLRLGLHYLGYKVTAALCTVLAPGPAAELVDELGSAFALLLGAVGGGGLILYVALLSSIQVAAG